MRLDLKGILAKVSPDTDVDVFLEMDHAALAKRCVEIARERNRWSDRVKVLEGRLGGIARIAEGRR